MQIGQTPLVDLTPLVNASFQASSRSADSELMAKEIIPSFPSPQQMISPNLDEIEQDSSTLDNAQWRTLHTKRICLSDCFVSGSSGSDI